MKKKAVVGIISLAMATMLLAGCALDVDKINDIIASTAGREDSQEEPDDNKNDASGNDITDNQSGGSGKIDGSDKNENENPGNPTESTDFELIQIATRKLIDLEYSPNYWNDLAYCSYYEAVLDAEWAAKYPKLQDSLAELNDFNRSEIGKEYDFLKEEAISMANNNTFMYTLYSKEHSYVKRADSIAVSILEHFDYYDGGFFENIVYKGYNYDPKTGELIDFYDVVTDVESFKKAVNERLLKYYDYFDGGCAAELDIYFGPENSENINWTLDNDGVTVYFNGEDIHEEAYESQIITVNFSECPDAYNHKYFHENEYIIEMPNHVPLYFDIDGNGIVDELNAIFYFDYELVGASLESMYMHDDSATTFGISIDNDKYAWFDLYSNFLRPYFVHSNDGDYIIVSDMREGGEVTHLYELSDTGFVESDSVMTFAEMLYFDENVHDSAHPFEYVFTDPNRLKVSLSSGVFSVFEGNTEGRLNDKHEFVMFDEYLYNTYDYSKDNYDGLKPYEHECLANIDISIINEDGTATGQYFTLKPEDVIRTYRTDCERVFDVILPDGQYGRIYMVGEKIEGTNKEPSDFFSNIFYRR